MGLSGCECLRLWWGFLAEHGRDLRRAGNPQEGTILGAGGGGYPETVIASFHLLSALLHPPWSMRLLRSGPRIHMCLLRVTPLLGAQDSFWNTLGPFSSL